MLVQTHFVFIPHMAYIRPLHIRKKKKKKKRKKERKKNDCLVSSISQNYLVVTIRLLSTTPLQFCQFIFKNVYK